MNDTRCPQEAFWEDLRIDVQGAKDEGDQIVIGGDFNYDMTSPRAQELMTALGLYNAVFELHGEEGPNTYRRGSKQINAILVSSTLVVKQVGYLPLICAVGDHRPIWIDVTRESMFGGERQSHTTKGARRLRLDDTRCKILYKRLLKTSIKEERLHLLAENQYLSLIHI